MKILDKPATLELLRSRFLPRGHGTGSGLTFRVAENLEDVRAAWSLVHDSYHRIGLIRKNEFGIHTVPAAVQPGTMVAIGTLEEQVCATISAYVDGAPGLSLDEVYPEELEALRAEGRVLMEAGLLADRRRELTRTLGSILELMKHVFYHAIYSGATDLVIGVHPHHVPFYERLFPFHVFTRESTCPSVGGAPVVGLRGDLAEALLMERPPRGLKYFFENPMEPGDFENRAILDPNVVAGTRIAQFLRQRYRRGVDRHPAG